MKNSKNSNKEKLLAIVADVAECSAVVDHRIVMIAYYSSTGISDAIHELTLLQMNFT